VCACVHEYIYVCKITRYQYIFTAPEFRRTRRYVFAPATYTIGKKLLFSFFPLFSLVSSMRSFCSTYLSLSILYVGAASDTAVFYCASAAPPTAASILIQWIVVFFYVLYMRVYTVYWPFRSPCLQTLVGFEERTMYPRKTRI
jgi:hypothetical protein